MSISDLPLDSENKQHIGYSSREKPILEFLFYHNNEEMFLLLIDKLYAEKLIDIEIYNKYLAAFFYCIYQYLPTLCSTYTFPVDKGIEEEYEYEYSIDNNSRSSSNSTSNTNKYMRAFECNGNHEAPEKICEFTDYEQQVNDFISLYGERRFGMKKCSICSFFSFSPIALYKEGMFPDQFSQGDNINYELEDFIAHERMEWAHCQDKNNLKTTRLFFPLCWDHYHKTAEGEKMTEFNKELDYLIRLSSGVVCDWENSQRQIVKNKVSKLVTVAKKQQDKMVHTYLESKNRVPQYVNQSQVKKTGARPKGSILQSGTSK